MPAMASNPRSDRSVGVALIGCGNVAEHYARALVDMPEVQLVGAFDVDSDRLHRFTNRHRLPRLGSLDQALRRDDITIVLNLTVPSQHATVTRSALEAAKHVYSEKPLASTSREARDLSELARARGLKLGVAPANWLGPSGSVVRSHLAAGALGPVRVIYVHADHGRVEQWHPRPHVILETGPVIDIGLYALALLTVQHGPVRKVTAVSARLLRTRRSRTRSFTIDRDDFVAASLTLADGALAQFTCNFYVDGSRSGGEAIEFHGDDGSLYLSSWAATNAAVWTVDGNGTAHHLMSDPGSASAIDWSLGIGDLINAVVSNREPQTSAEHAVHLLEVAEAIERSSATERTVFLNSAFPTPPPPTMPGQRSLRDGHGKSRPDRSAAAGAH